MSRRLTPNVSVGRHRERRRLAEGACFDTLVATVPIAVVTFQFDPFAHLFGDVGIRWATVALALVIVGVLTLAGVLARAGDLRAEDVAFVAVGVVPGAVVGARLGFLLLQEGFYGSTPSLLLDPSLGGLELGLAVVGGFLTGTYVASLLGAPVGRWLDVAAAPVLLGLGAGKLTMLLNGAGQGRPSDASWATVYLGPGPWGSLVPGLPSHPAQAYEGIATLAILAVLTVALMAGAFRQRDGRFFFVAVALWSVARALVSTTWRDPVVAAGLNAGGLIAMGIALGCVLVLLVISVRARRAEATATAKPADPRVELRWPDPEAGPPS